MFLFLQLEVLKLGIFFHSGKTYFTIIIVTVNVIVSLLDNCSP